MIPTYHCDPLVCIQFSIEITSNDLQLYFCILLVLYIWYFFLLICSGIKETQRMRCRFYLGFLLASFSVLLLRFVKQVLLHVLTFSNTHIKIYFSIIFKLWSQCIDEKSKKFLFFCILITADCRFSKI